MFEESGFSDASGKVRLDMRRLRTLLLAMEDAPNTIVRVGVFGNGRGSGKNVRFKFLKIGRKKRKTPQMLTNAELGFIQEYGKRLAPRIPARSWLMMPLRVKAQIIFRYVGLKLHQSVKEHNTKKLFTGLGVAAVKAIQQAFDTSGFGTWEPNAPSTQAKKGSASPLIDTGQLRRAVTFQVVKRDK